MKQTPTDELLKQLSSASTCSDLKAYTDSLTGARSQQSFSEFLTEKMCEKGHTAVSLIQSSQIQRNYGYQILSGQKRPGRDKIAALCLALELTLEETQKALTLACEAQLYAKNRRDSILIFCIQKHVSVMEANELLYDLGENTLC